VSRRWNQTFLCEPLRELTQELAYAPSQRRAQQVRRAERLHDEIEPTATYPQEYVVYRVTGYRPERSDGLLLVGQAVAADLRLLIDRVSGQDGVPPDEEDPAQPVAEVARRLGVSVKTIERWRHDGLRWRYELVPTNDKATSSAQSEPRLVIPQRALEQYRATRGRRVDKAQRFRRMDAATRDAVLRRARRLAAATDASLNRIASHLARRTGWGAETVRLMLLQHEERHPDEPIFRNRTAPLTPRDQRLIARAYRMGVPMARLCERFGRTRAAIYRVLRLRRARALHRLKITYVPAPIFERDDAHEVILRPQSHPLSVAGPAEPTPLKDVPESLWPLYARYEPSSDAVRSMFARYNFLKFRAAQMRDQLDRYEPRVQDMDRVEADLAQARLAWCRLVQAGLPVVLTAARRQLADPATASSTPLTELLEIGHRVLLDWIERFDSGRQQSFRQSLQYTLMRAYVDADRDTHRPGRRVSGEALLRQLNETLHAGDPA